MFAERLNYHFDVDEEQAGAEKYYYISQSIHQGLNAHILEFDIAPHETDYTDGSEMYLKLVFNVTDKQGKDIKADDGVMLCNGALGNFFSQCEVELNNYKLPAVQDPAYSSFLTNVLGSTPQYRDGVLNTIALTKLPMANESNITGINQVFQRDNKASIAESKEVTLRGQVPSDFLATCAQLIPNNVHIRIRLQRAEDNFILGHQDATKEYKINLLKCTLFTKRVRFNDAGAGLLERSLGENGLLKYQRLHTVTDTIPHGRLYHTYSNVYHNGRLPSRVFVGLIKEAAFTGTLNYYPMFFETAGVSSMDFLVDGTHIMLEPYEPTFTYEAALLNADPDDEKSDVSGPVLGLFQALEGFAHRGSTHNVIGAREWLRGFSIYAATLPCHGCNYSSNGSFNVDIKFAKPLKGNHRLMVFGEFENVLEVMGPQREFSAFMDSK